MKKKILLLSILLLTGCTGKVTYEFKENEILSNVEIQFTIAEYKEYQQQNGIEYTNDIFNPVKNDNLVRDTYNSSAIIATQKNDLYNYYTNKNFKKSNNYYIFEYEYHFDYSNFTNNYYLNNCFDTFSATEDKKNYYYKIEGKYNCSKEAPLLEIKANNRIVKSNASEKEKNIHRWDLLKTDNIYFVISKESVKKNENSSFQKTITIIVFIIILILTLITILLLRKGKKAY